MVQTHPDGVMADAEYGLQLLEGGRWMLLHFGVQALRIELAPMAPTGLGCQRSVLCRRQITIDATPGNLEAARGFGFGTTRTDKLHNSFTQIKGIGFHAGRLADNVPMSI